MTDSLKQAIQEKSRQLGFFLAGVTTPDPPPHYKTFENWLEDSKHGTMSYLSTERSRARRANPRLILPECESILVLAIPYFPALPPPISANSIDNNNSPDLAEMGGQEGGRGRVAAYAWGDDYHEVLPERLRELVAFIEEQVGHPVPNRWYTDTAPILERDLAQRAGVGWIGKNTCLINPRQGSYFLLAEIFLGIFLEPDSPIVTDHCGTCTRCIQACPTQCILPDRTLEARRCISYLTIELKEDIAEELRPMLKDWVFGCDICQMVCPWNRFADEAGDPAFYPREKIPLPILTEELELTSRAFNRKFKGSPVKRAKRSGYLRNTIVALGNVGDERSILPLKKLLEEPDIMIKEHTQWAIEQIQKRTGNK